MRVVDSDGKVSKNTTTLGGDITSVIGGTNCTVSGGTSGDATVNVDDAFLINDGSDTTTGTITAGGFTVGTTVITDDSIVMTPSTSDIVTIAAATNGILNVTTVDNSAKAADLTFTIDGKITMTPADITGDVFHLDANADSDNIVNIDAGALDIDVLAGAEIDCAAFSIDAIHDSNVTVIGEEKDLDISVVGGSTQELRLASAGTGASAIHLNASAGSIDIDSTDNVTVDAADLITLTTADTGADGKISLVSGVASSNTAIHLDGNADAASIVDIDAGILNIDSSGATAITAVGTAELAGSTVTLDSAAAITFEAHGSATVEVGKTSGTLEVVDLVKYLLPSDFIVNDAAFVRGYQYAADDAGSNYGGTWQDRAIDSWAWYQIPKGFKVTDMHAYGNTTALTDASIYQLDPNDGTRGSALASGPWNSIRTLSTAITSADDAVVLVVLNPNADTDIIYSVKLILAEV